MTAAGERERGLCTVCVSGELCAVCKAEGCRWASSRGYVKIERVLRVMACTQAGKLYAELF
jgi:hypothetical protein